MTIGLPKCLQDKHFYKKWEGLRKTPHFINIEVRESRRLFLNSGLIDSWDEKIDTSIRMNPRGVGTFISQGDRPRAQPLFPTIPWIFFLERHERRRGREPNLGMWRRWDSHSKGTHPHTDGFGSKIGKRWGERVECFEAMEMCKEKSMRLQNTHAKSKKEKIY